MLFATRTQAIDNAELKAIHDPETTYCVIARMFDSEMFYSVDVARMVRDSCGKLYWGNRLGSILSTHFTTQPNFVSAAD